MKVSRKSEILQLFEKGIITNTDFNFVKKSSSELFGLAKLKKGWHQMHY
jgi:hypothetical protein